MDRAGMAAGAARPRRQHLYSFLNWANARAGSTVYEQDLNGNGVKDGIEYDRTVAGPGKSGPPDGAVGAAESQLAFAEFKLGYHC